MILTCPACDTSYFVPDDAIGPNGRRVRCKSCGHDWRATLEEAPLELSPIESAPLTQEIEEASAPGLAETPAPELASAYRAKAEQKRRLRQAATQGVTWVAMGVVVIGLLAAAVAFRLPIVRAWPQTAGVYKAMGLPVNLTGLEIEAQRGKVLFHNPGRVVVSGALRNVRAHEVVAPPVRVTLTDTQGRVVAREIIKVDGPPVLPGQVMGFATVMDNPNGQGVGIVFEFAAGPNKTVSSEEVSTNSTGLRTASPRGRDQAAIAPLDKGGL